MNKKKLAKDSLWNIVDYVSTLLIFLVTTKILISEFGASGYGFYTFFLSLIGFFGMVDIGMGMVVSKYLSEFLNKENYHHSNQVITSASIFYAVASIFMITLVLVFGSTIIGFLNFGNPYAEIGVQVIDLIVFIFAVNLFTSILTNILVAREGWVAISLINIVFKVLSASILILIVISTWSLDVKFLLIFSMMLVVSILKLFSSALCVYNEKIFFKFEFPGPEVKSKVYSFLKFSSFQYVLSLMVGHFDKFIISRYFGLEALGLYNFCVNAFVYLYGFIVNALKVFFPKLSQIHGSFDFYKLKSKFIKLSWASFGLAASMSLLMVVLWHYAASWYIDDSFAEETFKLIPFFAVLLIVRSQEVVMYYFFNATANPRMLVINLLISAPVTVLLYFLLVPWVGVVGLVLSQILAISTVYSWHLYSFSKKGFRKHAVSG